MIKIERFGESILATQDSGEHLLFDSLEFARTFGLALIQATEILVDQMESLEHPDGE